MRGACLGVFLAVVVAGAVGCHSDNQVTCPVVLEPCPLTVPVQGTSCAPRGAAVFCEYGDDAQSDCNTFAYCDTQDGWILQPALPAPNCPTTLSADCPATFVEAMATGGQIDCASTGAVCRYPEGICDCTGPGLACSAPAAAGCPAARPLAGTACSGPCVTWGSGICDGQSMRCVCGTWQPIQCTK